MGKWRRTENTMGKVGVHSRTHRPSKSCLSSCHTSMDVVPLDLSVPRALEEDG